MKISNNQQLKSYTTFGVEAVASKLTEISSVDELKSLLLDKKIAKLPRLIMGGGSNILFSKDFDGIVIIMNNKGLKVIKEDKEHVFIKVEAGENWEDLVNYCIEKNLGGIENLTMIPGKVGSSPIQNIGAYGVELKDVFYELEAIEISTLKTKIFSRDECKFGYRDSVFKNRLKNQYVIASVTFKLAKDPLEFNLKYGFIEKELRGVNAYDLTVGLVAEAIRNIRKRKLPDPAVLGNAGSFFKNPILSRKEYECIKNTHSAELPAFVVSPTEVKIPAAWLIENSITKGKKTGNVGVHKTQPLVIVNYGNATGAEVLAYGQELKETVVDKFGVELEFEVVII